MSDPEGTSVITQSLTWKREAEREVRVTGYDKNSTYSC